MTTFALIGAGPGLGASVARRFGREGFSVALLARDRNKVEELASTLQAEGITARGFRADVRDASSLTGALDAAASELGPIEVLQYSPLPAKEFMLPILDTTAEDLVGPVEFSIYAPVNATRKVIPGMRELGRGTILFVNGTSAIRPAPSVAGTSIAFAGESAYGQLLHDAVKDDGIHVGQLIIPQRIGDGDPSREPDALAARLWSIHQERGPFRTFSSPIDEA